MYMGAQLVNIEKQIGQLFIVGAYSNAEDALIEGLNRDPTEYVEFLIEHYQIGGVLFKMRWDSQQVKAKTSHFQRLSSVHLLCCLDAEWGLSQRMVDGEVFPKNYALGTSDNLDLIYQTGREIGRQCREIGINVNFAPVIDINTNPFNPIINHRSFGSDPDHVARCGLAMMKGLQSAGVLACAKHFPGHGDTSVDSHTGLPIVDHSIERLESVELIPFKKMVDNSVDCVMGAHLMVPAIDAHYPTSLSSNAIQDLLKEDLGFTGLAVTDDLIMGAVKQNYSLEEAVVLAFLAGNDLILLSRDVEKGIQAIAQAVDEGRIKKEEIQSRIQKINHYRNKVQSNFEVERNTNLQRELYRSLIKGNQRDIDIFLQIGGSDQSCYFESDIPCIGHNDEISETATRIAVVIFGMQPTYRTHYGIQQESIQLIQDLIDEGKQVTVILHGDPAAKQLLPKHVEVIGAFDDSRASQEAVLDALLGHSK